MKTYTLKSASVLLPIGLFLIGSLSEAYYGKNSAEATIEFESEILTYDYEEAPVSSQRALMSDEEKEIFDGQIQYLMGTFQSTHFEKLTGFKGTIGPHYNIEILGFQPQLDGGTLIRFKYFGKGVFGKSAFKRSRTKEVPIWIPRSPASVYQESFGLESDKNPCTDPHYNGEEDFWYFWDPALENCSLLTDEEKKSQLVWTTATLKRTDEFRYTYPEYERLFGDNQNGDNLESYLFIGYIEDTPSPRKVAYRDDAYTAFRAVRKDLEARGYRIASRRTGFSDTSIDGKGTNSLYVYELELKVDRPISKKVLSRIHVLLSDTDIGSPDTTFHSYLAEAFSKGDLVVYDGHSGLGANLSLELLPQIDFSEKYQIYFFNGCSTYRYFTSQFFDSKGGTKNLDVVAAGLPTLSDSSAPNLIAFMDGFWRGKSYAYQTILRRLENSNGENGTYLVGVSGDEDNPSKR